MTLPENILTTAQTAAQAASEILLEYFGRAEVSQKSSRDLVTQADFESEAAVVSTIRDAFPNHQFLCEEKESTGNPESNHLWVIDPLDATNNYAHGMPHFSVSIAYAEKGQVLMGLILDPIRQEVFHAVRGNGAFLNGNAICVSLNAQLPDCIIATGFHYDRGELMERTLQTIGCLFRSNIRGIRRLGGACLDMAWVAAGRMDAFFEYKLSPWDYAAGGLIVEEAGGKCVDRHGNPWGIGNGSCMAANERVFHEFLEVVRWQD